MKSIRIICAAAALTASPAFAAEAVTASTDATFTEVYVGPNDTAPVYTGLGTRGISFGSGDPSTLVFNGASSIYAPPSAFLLGTITYYNGAITATSGVSGLTLSLLTTLSAPVNPAGDGIGTLNERIFVTNTTNTDDPEASADYITFASLGIGAYVYEGQTAVFNLLGTINSPLTLSEITLASEDGTGFVQRAPAFTTPITLAAGVPEPATWTMMLAGFALVGTSLRRRRHRADAVARRA